MATTTTRKTEPRLRRAHLAVAAIFAVHGSVSGSFATRIPWIQEHAGLSAGQLGFALVFAAVGASAAMPLAARIAHVLGMRAALRVLIGLWCASLALPALSPGLPWLCGAMLVYGASAGMADVVMNAQGVEVEERLGRSIMSGLHGMWSAGALIGSLVGVVAAHAGLDARVHLATVAAVLVATGLLVCGGVLDLRPAQHDEAPARFALPPRSALVIGAIGFCAVFAEGASMDWSAVYLRDITAASPGVAAASYTAFACTMAVSRLLGDLVVRRFGPVRTVRVGGVLATAGGVLVATAANQIAAIAGFALLGVGIAVVVPLCFAAAGRSGPNPSQAIAGVATVTYTSGLVAPAAIGSIAQASSLQASFGLVTLLAAGLTLGAGVLRAAGTSAAQPADKPVAVAAPRV
ncbi:MFS transporter [Streptomyces sp. NPDC088733]|uniref:MFS transporter n=1 Tax=Streptomyces sp. NPDC088733 TaxID=3365880 RepID=UPI00382E66E4